MSFSTVCPHCDARLTAPDSFAGKRIKCKKCGDPFVARPLDDESDEVPERPPARSSAKSRPRPVDDDEDDDRSRRPAKASRRDDEDDDRPRRRSRDDDDEPRPKSTKGKKKKKAGPPVLLFVLLGVAALLVIGGGVVGAIYYFADDKKPETPVAKGDGSTPAGPGTAVPGVGKDAISASWVEQHDAKGRYRIKFPTAPKSANQQAQTPAGPMSVTLFVLGGKNEVFASGPFPVPDRMGLTDEQLLEQGLQQAKVQTRGATIQSSRQITYQGLAGREVVLTAPGKKGTLVMRLILAGERMIMVMAGGETASADSPRVKAFFESLKIE